jgi:glycerol-3-phosphate dehydrogenase
MVELGRDRFDLVVVGGGIVGAGTAALAAHHGLRVALIERDDFASGSSSASSKLIHGGLRYLRMGDFRLVREALREASLLRRVVAPHLVHELEFVLPIYEAGPYGRPSIGAAMGAYSILARALRDPGRLVSPRDAAELVPLLRQDGLRSAGLYRDAETNDARLSLANVRAAAEAGAEVANRLEAAATEQGGDGLVVTARDLHGGGSVEIRTRAVVNASGAAVDEVRRLEDPAAGTSVTLSKGAHLVLERRGEWRAALTIPVDRDRVSFAIPWQGLLLLGTTDTPFDPAADVLEATAEDEAQILAEAARALPAEALRPEAVRARFAGLRVLPLTDGATAEARREVVLTRGPLGVVSVAGGKLTTYRAIARAVLRVLQPDLGLRRVAKKAFPLPGAADAGEVADELLRRRPELEPALARHLAHTYGSLAQEVLEAGSLEPLAPGALDVEAQAVYAAEREWALDPDDVLRRRTTLALRGLDTPELRERLRGLLARERIGA